MLGVKQKRKQSGFTIGEVVIASFMLTAGMTSVLSLIMFSYNNSRETQRIIVASELAQEGVELVRNIRDNSMADKAVTGVPADIFNAHGIQANIGANHQRCSMDALDNDLDCSAAVIGLSQVNGIYQHVAGATRYYRVIKTNHPGAGGPANNFVRVTSFVTWQDPLNNLNGNGAIGWCTMTNKCVYSEVYLTEWE